VRNIFFSCVILLGFICALPPRELSAQTEDENYVIKEDDILSITVRDEPEYSTVQGRQVRMDGMISFPMLGDIHVSGKTVKQLEEDLTERLKFFVNEPIVQVYVDKVLSYYVSVNGNVAKMGRYAIGAPTSGSPTTVLDVLAAAGGPTPTAKSKNIKIVRYLNGREIQYSFNYKDVINGKNMQQNITLQNRDIILVP